MELRELVKRKIATDDKRPDPGPLHIRASFVPGSANVEDRTVDIVWTTGASVRRWRWTSDFRIEEYEQRLEVSKRAVDLEFFNSGRAPFLDLHNAYSNDAILGVIVEGSVEIDEKAGEGRAKVRFDETELAERRFGSVRRGILRNTSVGFNIHENKQTRDPDEARGVVRELTATRWEPLETSAVPIGADRGSSVRDARAYVARVSSTINASEEGTVEDNSKDKNKAPAEKAPAGMTDEQRAAAVAEGQRIEAARQSEVRLVARTLRFDEGSEEVKAILSDPTKTVDVARAELLRAAAARDEKDPTSGARSGVTVGSEESEKRAAGIVTALMHRAFPNERDADGKRLYEIEPGSPSSEYAHRSLLWIAEDCLRRSGVDTRFMSRGAIASAALAMRSPSSVRSAGMISTSDFALILTDVTKKSLRLGYDITPRTFTQWARRVTTNDLKDIKRLQLSGGLALAAVAEGDEYTYGRTHEAKETYALQKFGRIIAITEETLINDDLDAFSRVGQIYGAAAADLESDVVYGVLGNNPDMADGVALFHGDHNNLATTNVGAPSVTSIGEGRRAVRRQTDLDGVRRLNLAARFLLSGTKHETTIDQMLGDIQASDQTGVIPRYIRSLVPVIEPRLDDFSEDAWYLLADPARIDTVEYAYLDGEEGLQITTRSGFEIDGVEIKAKMRFAAAPIDHRGMFKNAGA